MSSGQACKCGEETWPIAYPPNVLAAGIPGNVAAVPRLWRVYQRNCNHSAFGGGGRQWSAYSEIVCLRCGARWRTKAGYVLHLSDIAESEYKADVSSGHVGHRVAMQQWGRQVHPNHAADD